MRDDQFGYSVDISGEYAIVGAPGDYVPALNYGSASIYKLNGSTGQWEPYGPKLNNQYPQQDDNFGCSVSISGDYAIVGADQDDEGAGANQGSVCIFKHDAPSTSWVIQGGKLTDPDPGPLDEFGSSVAISGDYAIIGSPLDNGTAGIDEGSVSFFKRNEANGFWFPYGTKVYNFPPQEGEHFGASVDISGDFAVVGAPWDDDVPLNKHGAAIVLTRDNVNDTWIQHGTKLYNETFLENENFGTSVSISGNIVMVGTPRDNNSSGFAQGSAMIFMNIGPAWNPYQKFHDPGANFNDLLGTSCCIDSETRRFIIGAEGAYMSVGKVVLGKY